MLLIHLQVYNIFHDSWLFSSFYPFCVSCAFTYITSFFVSMCYTVLICSLLVLIIAASIYLKSFIVCIYYAKNQIRYKKNICKQDTPRFHLSFPHLQFLSCYMIQYGDVSVPTRVLPTLVLLPSPVRVLSQPSVRQC